MSKQKIGIMGGSFNPIHDRHIEIALAAMQEKNLDEVIFLPTGNPPHKKEGLEDAEHRYRMVHLAVLGLKNCSVSHIELERSGTIYTADTLELLHKQYSNTVFHYIIGEDTLHDLPNWHTPDRVFELCRFIVCSRSTNDVALDAIVRELETRGARFSFLSLPPKDISSTDIRLALSRGLEPRSLPPQVLEYIRIFGLYQVPASPKGFAENYDRVASSMKERRLLHSLLVSETARKLARLHGLEEEKAATAALLHDCAKYYPLESMQQLALELPVPIDEATMQNGNLLHGPAASRLAQKVYGVDDPDILNAILYHTIGRPEMSPLEMVIFLADKIEPSRKVYPALDEIRTLAKTDLMKAMELSISSSVSYVDSRMEKVHPQTLETLEWLRDQIKKRNVRKDENHA